MTKAPGRGGKRAATVSAEPEIPARDRIIDATMLLLAERPLGEIALVDIAREAGVSLVQLREHFADRTGILAAFLRRIDLTVLNGEPPDLATGPRDRLFEVEMRRFDALAPYKEAIRSLARSARGDPAFACVLHRLSARSQRWTLAAAGIDRGGLLGRIGVEGAVMIHVETMRVWLDDEDPDLGRTMAALDKALGRGERAMRLLGEVCAFVPRVFDCGRRLRDSGRAARATGGDA